MSQAIQELSRSTFNSIAELSRAVRNSAYVGALRKSMAAGRETRLEEGTLRSIAADRCAECAGPSAQSELDDNPLAA